ncbi:unnamed protein product [Camellia sinensis]
MMKKRKIIWVRLLAYEVADLCLGKLPLKSVSISATVADALSALKSSSDTCLSVWTCDHSKSAAEECRCVGKVCMVDVICYLCKDENLSSPSSALKSPVSVLLPKLPGLVRHVEPSSSGIISCQRGSNWFCKLLEEEVEEELHVCEETEISTFLHACEGDAVTKLTNEKIPYFNAPIYLQNKTQIGKVEEIFGPINEFRLYVEDMRSTRRGNCRSMKEEIGKHADVTTKLSSQLFLSPNIRHIPEMKHFGGSDTEAYSQHFEKRILKLEDNSNPRSDDRCSTTKIVKSHCTTEEV